MTNQHDNPFNITKAVDFSDQEIHDYWIDIPESGGFQQLVNGNARRSVRSCPD